MHKNKNSRSRSNQKVRGLSVQSGKLSSTFIHKPPELSPNKALNTNVIKTNYSKEKKRKPTINVLKMNINSISIKTPKEKSSDFINNHENEMKIIKEISLRHLNKINSTMRISEEIKKDFEEMKTQEKKLFEKKNETYLEKLFKILKDELVDFSLMIKESESKLENLILKTKPIKINSSNSNILSTPTNQSNNLFMRKTKPLGQDCDYIEIIDSLKKKNDELLSEMMDIKEKYMDTKIKNIDMKNKLKNNEKLKNEITLHKCNTKKIIPNTEIKKSKPKFECHKDNLVYSPEKSRNLNYSLQIITESNSKSLLKTYLEKLKEKSDELNEKEEVIKQLCIKVNYLKEIISDKESKEKANKDENKSKNNLDKLAFHRFYQFDTEYWGLISSQVKEKQKYQWININELKLNLNTKSLNKVIRLHQIENLFEKLKNENENTTKNNNDMKISLEYGIIEKENEVSKLKTQIKELMSKLKTVVNENENLSNIKINEINRLNADLILFRNQNEKYENEVHFNLNLIQELTEKLTSFQKEKIDDLQKLKDLEKKCTDNENENKNFKRSIEELESIKEENEKNKLIIENNIKQHKTEIEKIKIYIEENQNIITKNLEELEKIKKINIELKSQIENSIKNEKNFEEKLKNVKIENTENLIESQKEKNNLVAEINECKRKINYFNLQIEEKDIKFSNLYKEKKLRIEFLENHFQVKENNFNNIILENEKIVNELNNKCKEYENQINQNEKLFKSNEIAYLNSLKISEQYKLENIVLLTKLKQRDETIDEITETGHKEKQNLLNIIKENKNENDRLLEELSKINEKLKISLTEKITELNSLKELNLNKDNELISVNEEKNELITNSQSITSKCQLINEKLTQEKEKSSKLLDETDNLKREISLYINKIQESEIIINNLNEKNKNKSDEIFIKLNNLRIEYATQESLISQLKDQITLSQKEITENREFLSVLRKENENLKVEKNEIKQKSEEEVKNINENKAYMEEDCLDQIKSLKTKIKCLELECNNQVLINENSERILKKVEKENFLSSEKINTLNSEIFKLNEIEQTNRQLIISLETTIQDFRLEIDQYKEKLSNIENLKSILKFNFFKFREKENQRTLFESMIKDYQENLVSKENDISELTEKNTQLNEKLLELQQKLVITKNYNESFIDYKIKNFESLEIVSTNNIIYNEENSCRKKIEKEQEIENLRKLNDNQINALKEHIKEIELEKMNYKSENNKLKEQINQVKIENNLLRNQINSLEKSTDILRQKVKENENETLNLRQLFNQKDNQISSLKNEISVLMDLNNKKEFNISSLNDEIKIILNDIKLNEDKNSLIKKHNEELLIINKENENQIVLLKYQIDVLGESIKKKENEITSNQMNFEELKEQQVRILKEEKLKFDVLEKNKETEINAMKTKISDLSDLNNNKSIEISRLDLEFNNKIIFKEEEINLLKDEIKQLIEITKQITPKNNNIINEHKEFLELKQNYHILQQKDIFNSEEIILLKNKIRDFELINDQEIIKTKYNLNKINQLSCKIEELEKINNEISQEKLNLEKLNANLTLKIDKNNEDLKSKDLIINNKQEELILDKTNLNNIQENYYKDKLESERKIEKIGLDFKKIESELTLKELIIQEKENDIKVINYELEKNEKIKNKQIFELQKEINKSNEELIQLSLERDKFQNEISTRDKFIEILNNRIIELEKETREFKIINDDLLNKISNSHKISEYIKNENTNIDEKYKAVDSDFNQTIIIEEEDKINFMFQINILKDLIIEKDNQIIKYEKELSAIKNTDVKSNYEHEFKSKDNSINLSGDDNNLKEKIEICKKRLKQYKQETESMIHQNILIKNELKNIQIKYNSLLTFEGKILNYEEFRLTINKILENYKPKGKENEDAIKRIREHLNETISEVKKEMIIILDNKEKEKEKKSFFSKIFSSNKK